MAALLAVLSAPSTAAPVDPPDGTRGAGADSTRHYPSPFSVMLRSAIVPGWGQVVNHKYLKALVVVGGEGLLIYKAAQEYQKELDAAEAGDEVGRDRHYNLKVNYIWWGIAVHLLQMADAYVDAHLATFSADIGPDGGSLRSAAGPPDPKSGSRLAVAVHVRF